MCKFVVRGLLPLVAIFALPASARVAELGIERLVMPLATGENLRLRLQWPDGADAGELVFEAKRLVVGDTGYVFRNLRWTCKATRTAPDTVACDGELRATNAPVSTLRARWSAGQLELHLKQLKIMVDVIGPPATSSPPSPSAWTIAAKRVPATWLAPMLAGLWPEGSITGGQFDASWSIAGESDGTLTAGGPLTLSALGIDSSDGRLAAASLDADGRLDLRFGAATRIAGDLTLHGGELLLGSLYASLPETPITFGWQLAGTGSRWSIERFAWNDPKVLDLQATGTVDAVAAAPLRNLDAIFAVPDAAIATPRYFDSLLGSIGLAGLQLRGGLRGTLQLGEGGLQRLDLTPASLTFDDANQRFGIDALDGTLRIDASATPVDSKLAWRSAHVHGIALGPATLALRSSGRGIALAAPATIPALGGNIVFPKFAWRPAAVADATAALDLALSLHDIDLKQLSTALGWPAFGGTLSGDIPGVRYADSVIDLQGGLAMRLFDGDMRIDALTLERPFGVAPTMTGAIVFSNLDLKPLTGAFGFGEITGRLGGYVRDLRLVDWTPVAFDARFETSTKAKDPRRISQRAVRDLTEVGGGGIAAGLQAQVLKVFQTFGYARIGLSCTLANDVCRMGGLDGGDGGYTIVEGAGLPRVTVVGHQRQVDWPVLVARLKAATEGQAPIID